MLTAFARAFKTPDLRKKLLFTLGIIVVYRVGTHVPIRYTTMMASVKSSFLRRSGVLNARANAVSTVPPATPAQLRQG